VGLAEPSAVLAALGLEGVNLGVYGGTPLGGAWSGGGPTVQTVDPATGKVSGGGRNLPPPPLAPVSVSNTQSKEWTPLQGR